MVRKSGTVTSVLAVVLLLVGGIGYLFFKGSSTDIAADRASNEVCDQARAELGQKLGAVGKPIDAGQQSVLDDCGRKAK